MPFDRRCLIQLEVRDAGRDRRQTLLEFDSRQRFADATMGPGAKDGKQPRLVGSTDVEHVGITVTVHLIISIVQSSERREVAQSLRSKLSALSP